LSAFTNASLIARTSSWDISTLFALRRWTWLLTFFKPVSLESFTSPALYLPSDIFWNSAREMFTLDKLMLPTAIVLVPFYLVYTLFR